MLLAALATGRLLPTWMFLNTLQLISHLPLFKSEVNAPASYFISQFLDLTRFNVVWELYHDLTIRHGYFLEGALNMTFEAYGYPSMYLAGNMPFVLLATVLIVSLFCLAIIKKGCVRASNKAVEGGVRDIFLLNNHGHWMVNFAIRFYYEVFLIICVSSLIALSKERQENVIPELNAQHDPKASHSALDRKLAISLLVLVGLSLLVAFVRAVTSCKLPSLPSVSCSLSKLCSRQKAKPSRKT